LRRSQPTGAARSVLGFGFAAAFLISAYALVPGFTDGDPTAQSQCVDDACELSVDGSAAASNAFQAAAVGATGSSGASPCPYCGQDANLWRAQTAVQPPEIGGKAAAVVEASCGMLVYGLNQDVRFPPASLVKMATALVVSDIAKLDDRVTVQINGWNLAAEDGSSIMGLVEGMNLSVEELLYGMLLPSGNDAALALAEHLGGNGRVVGLMNQRVQRLGLQNTQFTNVDGRHNPDLYSTAFDMTVIGREMMANAKLREIASTQRFTPAWSGGQIWNGNYLLYIYPGTLGVKTGYTEEANSTIVAAVERDGRTLDASILGSWDAYWDAMRLFNWAFANTTSTCRSNS
jgi:D-alanyl-D-alanine carboxypeptidase